MAKVETGHQKFLIKSSEIQKNNHFGCSYSFCRSCFHSIKNGWRVYSISGRGDFAVEMRILQGSNINETKKVTTQASGILLKQFPEVQKIVVKIGSAEIPTEPMPMDAGDMIIVLKPKKNGPLQNHSLNSLKR